MSIVLIDRIYKSFLQQTFFDGKFILQSCECSMMPLLPIIKISIFFPRNPHLAFPPAMYNLKLLDPSPTIICPSARRVSFLQSFCLHFSTPPSSIFLKAFHGDLRFAYFGGSSQGSWAFYWRHLPHKNNLNIIPLLSLPPLLPPLTLALPPLPNPIKQLNQLPLKSLILLF